ncbi:MAG: Gfo/Idh/MocA family oxidoreductase [Candidatus Latescibacterota bacterium]
MNDSSKNSNPIRVAIVGLGKMGLVHAATLRTDPRVQLCAMCDTSKFMVQTLKNFLPGIHFYRDYHEMIDKESIDAIFVTTPTGSHAQIAGDCVKAGKHLFVEKPLGTDLADAVQVADAVREKGVQSQVGYVCRYSPTFEKAKEILDAGAIGTVLSFGSVKYSSDVMRKVEKSWRFMRKKSEGGGGVVNEFACHGIDLLVWMFGEPAQVHAKVESWYSAQVEDYVHAVFDYGDYSGWIDSSWSMQDYRKPYTRIEVTGDNGKLTVTDSELQWLINRDHAGHEAGWHSTNITELYEPTRIFVGDIMFTRQADAFIEAVGGGRPARSAVPEALRTQRVLEAIHQNNKR